MSGNRDRTRLDMGFPFLKARLGRWGPNPTPSSGSHSCLNARLGKTIVQRP